MNKTKNKNNFKKVFGTKSDITFKLTDNSHPMYKHLNYNLIFTAYREKDLSLPEVLGVEPPHIFLNIEDCEEYTEESMIVLKNGIINTFKAFDRDQLRRSKEELNPCRWTVRYIKYIKACKLLESGFSICIGRAGIWDDNKDKKMIDRSLFLFSIQKPSFWREFRLDILFFNIFNFSTWDIRTLFKKK